MLQDQSYANENLEALCSTLAGKASQQIRKCIQFSPKVPETELVMYLKDLWEQS